MSTKISSALEVVHYYSIRVYTRFGNGKLIEHLMWDRLPWETRIKFEWYFKYRAALLQVKYPKYYIDCSWGNEPAVGKSLEDIKKNKIVSKKRTITKFKNKLKKAEDNWTDIFPISEYPLYIKSVAKIKRLESELIELLNEQGI